jgi:hypothetical protein
MVPGDKVGRQENEDEQQELGSFFDVHGENSHVFLCFLGKTAKKKATSIISNLLTMKGPPSAGVSGAQEKNPFHSDLSFIEAGRS